MQLLSSTQRVLALSAIGLGLIFTAACTQHEAGAANSLAASKAPSDTLTDSALVTRADMGRTIGSDSAPIWIVMISDYQCPYCKQFHDSTLKSVMRDYVQTGKARFAYLHLPLQQHPHSRPAARAAMCASSQGKFWEYSDSVFARQEQLKNVVDASALFSDIGRTLSLDMPAFEHCRKSQAIESVITSDLQKATSAGVRSTPSFFIGNFLLEGNAPYGTFRGAIDSALAVAGLKRSR